MKKTGWIFTAIALVVLIGGASIFPSLTVERLKNRCIPCVYWAAAIFLVVTEYSNLFFSFAFFLDGFHFTFGYELIIRSETTGIMKIVCDSLSFV